MKIIKLTRKYFNEHVVEKNPDLVQALNEEYRENGRPSNFLKRSLMVMDLCIKYNILNYNPMKEKFNTLCNASYPESEHNQKEEIGTIHNGIKTISYIVCDIWNVLLSLPFERQQILGLVESKYSLIGLSCSSRFDDEQMAQIVKTIIDFTVINRKVEEILKQAALSGKIVVLYNNSDFSDEIIRKILNQYGLKYKITDSVNTGLHITNKCENQNDVLYKDVNELGKEYRPYFYPNVVTAFYNQLVNMKFHSGEEKFSSFYEYGYTCGGILTCGFCQFLEELVQKEKIDKILFVARDGDIMNRVYKKYFNHVESSYLIFSRFASYELIFEDFPEEYVDKNVKTRIDRKECDNSFKKIISECGLECITKYLVEEGLEETQTLTYNNFECFRNIIRKHKDDIQQSFQETCSAAEQYFMREVTGKKKVCIVDLGWNGKSIAYLKYLLEKKYHWAGKITGAMIGAADSQLVQSHIRTGLIHTYAFENEFWRNMGTDNGKHMDYKECICLEELFSSPNDTLLRYKFDHDGNTDFIYGKKNKNKKTVEKIHQGIMDFAEQFMPVVNKYGLCITARDAYTPTDVAMCNRNYLDLLYEKYDEEVNAINGF